jgi:predicted nuclease of predicted toxin-antitoxin system
MRFLCDMGVSLRVVDWLRGQNHDSVHLRDEGLQRLPNGEVFSKAIAEDRIVVTFDLDFGEVAAMAGGRVASVIVFRLRNARADHVIKRLSIALDRAGGSLQRGAIVVVEESRLRIRELPIGEPE